jgi:hypothetical protein
MTKLKPAEAHQYKISWEGITNGERFVKSIEITANTPAEAKIKCEANLSSTERVIFIDASYPGFKKIYLKKTVTVTPELTLPNAVETADWFQLLVDEAGSTITEAMFQSNWIIIEGYHKLGKLVEDNRQRFTDAGINNPVPMLAKHIKKSERTVYRAVQFFNAYPNLELLPEGKDTSWHQIVNKYLPASRDGGDKEDTFRLQFTATQLNLIILGLDKYCFNSLADNRDVALDLLKTLENKRGGQNEAS